MCQHHHAPTPTPEQRAIALEHGAAHDRDHAAWSRRGFLTAGASALGGAMLLGHTPVQALGLGPRAGFLGALARSATDRTLVLVQLSGGNDGLNTVVPIRDDEYYRLRPTIALRASETIQLDADTGLHPALDGLRGLWDQGQLGICQTVGYPSHNMSHFRSTDIWASGSAAGDYVSSGWTGRFLDEQFPGYLESPPDYPVAIRLGGATSVLLRGTETPMGMSLSGPGQLRALADTGALYDETGLPPTPHGDELRYVRSVYNASLRYRDAVVTAADRAANAAEYPAGRFGESLAVIARLIKGGLASKLYVLNLGSFDTHSDQLNRQASLFRQLGDGLAAFYQDLEAGGAADRALTMTFSEFGRRVFENGANGTDHGTAAPLFVLGGGVQGGLYGDAPDLQNLSGNNLRHSVDFRQVYAGVLGDWFGLAPEAVTSTLYGEFDALPFVLNPITSSAPAPHAAPGLRVEAVFPNPVHDAATVAFRLDRPVPARLSVVDVRGREVAVLLDTPRHPAGAHRLAFRADGLPSGTYTVRLHTPAGQHSRRLTVVR